MRKTQETNQQKTTRVSTQLSRMEQQLLQAVSTGASNKNIALMLSKSEFTVRNRLSSLYKKINVINRVNAAFWYRDHAVQFADSEPRPG